MEASVIALNASFKARKMSFNDLGWRAGGAKIVPMAKAPKKTRDPENVALGRVIRRYRQLRGLSLADLAEKMGKSEGQMSKFETGENALSWKQVVKAASILKVSAYTLANEATTTASPETAELRERVESMTADQQRGLLSLLRGSDERRA